MPKNFDPNKWIRFVKKIKAQSIELCKSFTINPDDVEQETWMALYEADQRYDPSYNVKFSTYAIMSIRRKIKHLINRANTKDAEIARVDNWDSFESRSKNPAKIVELRDEAEHVLKFSQDPELLILHFGIGRSYRDLAKELGIDYHQTLQRQVMRDVDAIRSQV